MMKKVFLSLLLAIVCVPAAFSQTKTGALVVTDTAVCGSYTWPVNNVTYDRDTTVVVMTDTASYVLHLTSAGTTVDTANVYTELTGYCFAEWNNKRCPDRFLSFSIASSTALSDMGFLICFLCSTKSLKALSSNSSFG